MSARASTVWPVPFRMIPTTPVRPICSRTSYPSSLSFVAASGKGWATPRRKATHGYLGDAAADPQGGLVSVETQAPAAQSITAELQGATTQYGCKYGRQRWGTVGPRTRNFVARRHEIPA